RRLGPDARGRRVGVVLARHDRLDHRAGHDRDARLHRAVLARLVVTGESSHPRAGTGAIRPSRRLPGAPRARPRAPPTPWRWAGLTLPDKLLQRLAALGGFAAVMAGVLVVVGRAAGRRADVVAGVAFTAPALLLRLVGLLYPAARTAVQSVLAARSAGFVGLDNYVRVFTQPDLVVVMRNTLLWVVITPILSTAIGLVYAVLVDRTR